MSGETVTDQRLRPCGIAGLILLPELAYAQHVPTWLVFALLSPILVILLVVVLGFLTRNWRSVAVHSGLLLVWVLLFAVAANSFDNDYIIWTPLVLFALHALYILLQVIMAVTRIFAVADTGKSGDHETDD